MKHTFLIPVSILVLTGYAAGQGTPRTVRDYFMALPAHYFSLDCCETMKPRSRAKREYLRRYQRVLDVRHGYMSGDGDAAQEGFVMVLFKKPGGGNLVAFYTRGEGGVEDTPWTIFLDYNDDKWTDVSRRYIPRYNKAKYIYELARNATTIHVYAKDENGTDIYRGKKLYDLTWKNGKFVR